jgi:hypothetical protein
VALREHWVRLPLVSCVTHSKCRHSQWGITLAPATSQILVGLILGHGQPVDFLRQRPQNTVAAASARDTALQPDSVAPNLNPMQDAPDEPAFSVEITTDMQAAARTARETDTTARQFPPPADVQDHAESSRAKPSNPPRKRQRKN